MRRAPRRLTVLASLDVAGFTRLIEQDERRTLFDLAQLRRHVLRPTIANHGGNLFKTMGDGALIEFPSVEDGVEWAIEFQTKMDERNFGRPTPLLVRVGVALADVFVEGNDRYGAAVGFVVRLQQAAPPGGIAITHSARWQLVKSLAAQFDRTEWVEFKNMDEQFEIFLWRRPGEAPVPEPRSAGVGHRPIAPPLPEPIPEPPPAFDRPSIAVLAFDNLSNEPGAEVLADGIVEEITATLSRIRDFTVIARNSSYAFKGKAVDIRTVARQFGVRYVLEGSIRKAGERVRITAQLIDAATGAHIWADSYDGVVQNVFDFEDEIAERVAGALHPSIRAAEIALAKRKRPESLLAYDLTLKALPHLWAHRREDNCEAIRLLDEALKTEPTYARAAAIAAWARAQNVVYNWTADFESQRQEGAVLIERAASMVEDDPTALCALSSAVMLLHADMGGAQHFVDRALALDPNHAWSWTRRGFLNVYSGDPASAITCFERSIKLSPLDPFSFNSFIGLGLANFSEGRAADAVQWTVRAMREKAGMTWAYRDLAVFLAHAGRIDEAREAVKKLVASRPYLTVSGVADALQFMAPDLLARYLGGLRIAGLPE